MKNKKILKKSLKWIVAVLIVIALIILYLYESTKPLEVEGQRVQKIDIRDTFEEEGTVEAAYEDDIYSSQSGEIQSLNIREGQRIKSGDVILSMDTSELERGIDQLEGQLKSISGQQNTETLLGKEEAIESQRLSVENARKEYEEALKGYERGTGLYEQEAISQDDIERLKKEMEIAENVMNQQIQALSALESQYSDPQARLLYFQGQREAVRAQIELFRYKIGKSRIYAGKAGIVKSVNVDEKQYIAPGQSIATLIGDGGIEVESRVLAKDAVDLRPGMDVKIVLEHEPDDFTFEGSIKRINPYASESVSAIGLVERRVDVKIDLRGDYSILKPGYSVDVEFLKRSQKGAIAVPKRAIFKHEGEDAIWKIVSEKAVIQKVSVGYETDDYSIIDSGLDEGDIVILNHKTDGLDIDKRVKPVFQ
ncbi:HlyD family secretion protein [Peptoclostridium litorale DSM 5388]|uniref:Efflux transporter, RND family, MFP subunit n=1 Tax=Peptoclostridium litorale DSM 5388 TaxID=1121324 RepID=A0A069RKF5_PEPLI|nr:efflux RND transporter periplasmic adaptor subunit [Peptoclostridium litorale]KDR94697.1 efflux transporter, RND family, MFP subunit [Peptoclostridium litorale DSM 5388]SIO32762.1 HlyD family secretion protein [Peptoclostridium litorale DSM 5388]